MNGEVPLELNRAAIPFFAMTEYARYLILNERVFNIFDLVEESNF